MSSLSQSQQQARPVAPSTLTVTPRGDLIALNEGELLTPLRIWQANVGQARLGFRLLLLAAQGERPLSPELDWGRRLARAALTRVSQAASDRVPATPSELLALLTGAPDGLRSAGLTETSIAAAWQEIQITAAQALRTASIDLDHYCRLHGVDPDRDRLYLHLAERQGDKARPFAFLATVSAGRGPRGQVQHSPLAAAIRARTSDPTAQELLLAPLRRAAGEIPRIRELLDSHELFHPVAWTAEQAYEFLRYAPNLEALGVTLNIPLWWKAERPRPQIRAEIGGGAPPVLGLSALLDFQLRYFIGDDELTAEEWRVLMGGGAGLRNVRGRWIHFDPANYRDAHRHWERIQASAARGAVGFIEGMRLIAGVRRDSDADADDAPEWTVAEPGPWLARALGELQSPAGSPDADPGEALHGQLRPYQREGVSWLWLLIRLGLGGCLADDMGLGKTIQVISLLLLLKRQGEPGPHLIVMPASLLANWRAELTRFGPELRLYTAHRSVGDVDVPPPMDDLDVVLTTYGTLLRQEWIQERAWGLVVLDEAQAIKNAATKQTRAAKALSARHRLILTGTPVENSLTDLWSLFDFCNPGLLGSANEFKSFHKRLGADRDGLAPLRALVRPYVLRRLKTDRRVINDLPDKTELAVYCGLTRAQAALYGKAVDQLAAEVSNVDGIRRRGVILAYLTRFKQICNHPAHYTGDGRYDVDASAKFQRLQELCTTIHEAGEKVLVFTQFREICEPLAQLLAATFGRPGLVLHGGTPVARRPQLVAEFQREDGPPFMVLSLKAGGTGLNLTAAAHVVHFDRWWNPAVENQATDRAYRIGQHKNVLVHKFVCRGTLEERIDAMIQGKRELADGVLADDGERRLTELSTDELLRVVTLDLRTALSED
ncbi:MAG: DEAD/DEAH box helicase [Nannocystis sp.]|nr:DEAD/DEAH box helicase [Nannocystis sp.]